MKLFSMFGIGSGRILSKNCSVTAAVSLVRDSYLYVIKSRCASALRRRTPWFLTSFTSPTPWTELLTKVFSSLPPTTAAPARVKPLRSIMTLRSLRITPAMPSARQQSPLDGDQMLKFKCLVLDHDDTVVRA